MTENKQFTVSDLIDYLGQFPSHTVVVLNETEGAKLSGVVDFITLDQALSVFWEAVDAAKLIADLPEMDSAATETPRSTETHFNQVRVNDLLDSTTSFLYCPICDGRYSANKADYFMRSPDHVLMCCNEPMWLATESRTITRQAVSI